MKTLGRVLGAIGLVLLVPIPLVYFGVGGGWNWLFTTQVVVGVAMIAFFGFTNLDGLGRLATGRGTFFIAFSTLATVIVVGLVVTGDWVANESGWTKDLTQARLFTLAPQSVKVAEGLKQPVKILAFYRGGASEFQGLKDLVARYQDHTQKLKLESVDPDKEPLLVKQYKVNLYGNRVVAVMGGKSEKITELDEQGVTNALLKLTRGAAKKSTSPPATARRTTRTATAPGVSTSSRSPWTTRASTPRR